MAGIIKSYRDGEILRITNFSDKEEKKIVTKENAELQRIKGKEKYIEVIYDNPINQRVSQKDNTPIIQYDENMNVIQYFLSVKKASEKIFISTTTIYKSLKNNSIAAKKYYFRYI